MGCCGSKGGAAGAEARDARRERERERRRANGADDEDEDDAVSSSRARVHAWQMEADDAEEEDDASPEPDGLVGGLDEERAGKWVSKSARAAMARAFPLCVRSPRRKRSPSPDRTAAPGHSADRGPSFILLGRRPAADRGRRLGRSSPALPRLVCV